MMLEPSASFYIESLYIQVENEVFDVPRYYFEQNCGLVSLISPRPREENGNGWSKERPIVLKDISAKEFLAFLRFRLGDIYGFTQNSSRTENDPGVDWESVLRVSALLGFQAEKKEAIDSLHTPLKDTPIERVQLARFCSIEEWLVEGYTTLVRREAPLEEEEIEALGYRVAINLLKLRDRGYHPTGSIEEVVRKEVKDELMEPSKVEKYQGRLALKGDRNGFEDVSAGSEVHQVAHSAKYVVIRVQNILFRVPAGLLTEKHHSHCSPNWFASQIQERQEDSERCLELDDVTHEDFTTLLHAIWPSAVQMPSTSEKKQDTAYWPTVLKLSTKWDMGNARSLAIDKLSSTLESRAGGTDIAKVTFAREYNVRRWLLEAYLSIVNREAMITVAEREVLGVDVALGLMELRDVYKRVGRKFALMPIADGALLVKDINLEEVARKFPDGGIVTPEEANKLIAPSFTKECECKAVSEEAKNSSLSSAENRAEPLTQSKSYGSAAVAARLSRLRGAKK